MLIENRSKASNQPLRPHAMPVPWSSQPTTLRGCRRMIKMPTMGKSAVMATKRYSPIWLVPPQSSAMTVGSNSSATPLIPKPTM